MSFVQRELDRIHSALSAHPERYAELYAAQQALAWTQEPTGFSSPVTMILDTLEGSEDYPPSSNPAPS
jgi:hypothetical protein